MLGRFGRPGLIGTMARTAVIAGTASAVGGRISHRQQQKYAQQEQAQYEQAQYEQQQAQVAAQREAASQQAASRPPAGEPAYMAELEKLAQLKAQGVVTEDEFQAKKRQLLGI
jgi:hypothetical protein